MFISIQQETHTRTYKCVATHVYTSAQIAVHILMYAHTHAQPYTHERIKRTYTDKHVHKAIFFRMISLEVIQLYKPILIK